MRAFRQPPCSTTPQFRSRQAKHPDGHELGGVVSPLRSMSPGLGWGQSCSSRSCLQRGRLGFSSYPRWPGGISRLASVPTILQKQPSTLWPGASRMRQRRLSRHGRSDKRAGARRARTEMNTASRESPFTVVPMALRLLSQPRGGPNGFAFERSGAALPMATRPPYDKPLL